jgi:hypothetical protein
LLTSNVGLEIDQVVLSILQFVQAEIHGLGKKGGVEFLIVASHLLFLGEEIENRILAASLQVLLKSGCLLKSIDGIWCY